MGPGNHMDRDQFAYLFRCRSTGISGSFHRTHIAPNHDCHKAASHLFLSHQLNIGRLDHGIGCLNSTDEAFGFDHSQRIGIHNYVSFLKSVR